MKNKSKTDDLLMEAEEDMKKAPALRQTSNKNICVVIGYIGSKRKKAMVILHACAQDNPKIGKPFLQNIIT